MENEKVLLSIKEASELSGLGQSKLYELCRQPDCEFVIKLGDKKLKKNLIHRAKLLAWLDGVKEL